MAKEFATFWASQPGLFLMLQAIGPVSHSAEGSAVLRGSNVWDGNAMVVTGLLLRMMVHDDLESIAELTECGCGGM